MYIAPIIAKPQSTRVEVLAVERCGTSHAFTAGLLFSDLSVLGFSVETAIITTQFWQMVRTPAV